MARKPTTLPSPKQQEILDFIEDSIRRNGYPPSIREICSAVGLTSSSTVFTHLAALEKKGYIEKDDSKTRGIRLTGTKSAVNPFFTQDIDQESVNVPVIGKVTAGMPILAVENVERTFPVPGDFLSGEAFMLHVSGESMIEAGILDGDYILVQRQATARDGDIVVALIEDEATVKTFYKERDCFRLQPENRYMKAIYTKELLILGKVVGVFRKL